MLMRVIVAVIGIPLILLVVFLAPVWVLGILMGAISAVAAWEFLRCTEKGIVKPRFTAYAAVAAFCIPFLAVFYNSSRVYELAAFLLLAVMSVELMLSFLKETPMRFETVAAALLAGAVFPVLLSGVIRLATREAEGRVYALLPFVAAFASDSGAYLVGLFLGKHQLTPRLSPHKTLEGRAGGFVLAIALMLVYGLILRASGYTVNFAVMGVYGFLGSLAAQLGDLSFSAVKRLYDIKDYGKLLPGHGGALDRFDSMIWVAALLDLIVRWVPAIYK